MFYFFISLCSRKRKAERGRGKEEGGREGGYNGGEGKKERKEGRKRRERGKEMILTLKFSARILLVHRSESLEFSDSALL